jgi:uncharacterized protein with PIN domain
MRLYCDEMLLRVGKWLRAAGYDTAIATRGAPDETVVAEAVAQERVLLTCDKRMLPLLEKSGVAYLLLETSRARDAVPVLAEILGVDMQGFAAWSRCLACNVLLEDMPAGALPEEWKARVPHDKELYRCPACKHVYWEGSHVKRLDARLDEIRATSGARSPGTLIRRGSSDESAPAASSSTPPTTTTR